MDYIDKCLKRWGYKYKYLSFYKNYNPNDINKSVKKTFGELYKKTMKREKELTDCGYKVVSIWESDFEKIIYDNL